MMFSPQKRPGLQSFQFEGGGGNFNGRAAAGAAADERGERKEERLKAKT
jgi:hypothetical protein